MQQSSTRRPARRGSTTKRPNGGVRRLDSGRWQARAVLDGVRRVVGSYATEREAWEAIEHVRSDHRRGRLADFDKSATPFAVVAEQWLATTSTTGKERTAIEYERIYRTRLEPTFADLPIGKITTGVVKTWLAELRAEGLSPRTISRYLTVLRGAFGEAKLHEMIVASPLDALPLRRLVGKVERSEPPALSIEQLDALAHALDRLRADEEQARADRGWHRPLHCGYDPALLVVTMTMCGAMRAGEAEGLLVADLDTTGWTLAITKSIWKGAVTTTKTDAGHRTVPVPASLRDRLAAHVEGRAPDAPLFTTSEGKRWTTNNFRERRWPAALAAAGLPPMRIHDLRRTGVSLALGAGMPPSAVAKWCGHSNAAVTLSVYAHDLPDGLDRVAVALDGLRTGEVVLLRRTGVA